MLFPASNAKSLLVLDFKVWSEDQAHQGHLEPIRSACPDPLSQVIHLHIKGEDADLDFGKRT